MSTLIQYLAQKRDALLARRSKIKSGELGPVRLKAEASAEGRSGIRRIRIRDFQVLSDSPPDFAGYDLGPSSPELQLGVLGSCLTHSYLIQAADLQIPVESLKVTVEGQLDPRAGQAGHEQTPVHPHDLSFTVHVVAAVSDEQIRQLQVAVERSCPILNLLQKPQSVTAKINHTRSARATTSAAA